MFKLLRFLVFVLVIVLLPILFPTSMAKSWGYVKSFLGISSEVAQNVDVSDFREGTLPPLPDVSVPDLPNISIPNLPDVPNLPDAPPESSTATETTAPTVTVQVAGHSLTQREYSEVWAEQYDTCEWRKSCSGWYDFDDDGCDTRQEVLIRDSLTQPIIESGCDVVAGEWFGPYSYITFNDPSDLDIDHMVPLKNAAASGGQLWIDAKKREFANDMDGLLATSASFNRSKSDRSPDSWRPGLCTKSDPTMCATGETVAFKNDLYSPKTWCEYSSLWAEIKDKYDLSATKQEIVALQEMQQFC